METAPEFAWPPVLDAVAQGEDLPRITARAAMTEIMEGRATPAQVSALIVALRIKGETIEEMTGLVEAMRAAAVTIDVGLPVVDTAGTGGDRSGTFNISTAAALVTAGAGVTVAKHGNRSASSRCGSADVLEGLGMVIDLAPEATVRLIRETGFGYLHAPLYHPAMKHAGPVRRELGIPTVFNFLGPLANPAGARLQSLGVADAAMAERMVGALRLLGSDYAFVFYGEDGLDELTTTATSFIYRLKDGEVTHAEFTPEDFRVERAELADLAGGDVDDNVRIIREVLDGRSGAARDVVLVNAAPALVASGTAFGFEEAMRLGAEAIDSGAAADLLQRVIDRSHELV